MSFKAASPGGYAEIITSRKFPSLVGAWPVGGELEVGEDSGEGPEAGAMLGEAVAEPLEQQSQVSWSQSTTRSSRPRLQSSSGTEPEKSFPSYVRKDHEPQGVG